MKGKIGSKILSLIFSHWLLKIISLVLAFALWFIVISTNDPVDEKRFQNIKVNLLNTELLTQNDQVYEVLDNTDVLRIVTFDAPNSVRREIQSSDIIAEADLTNLTVTNTVEIKFYCPKYGDQVQNISGNIEYVKLNIEKKARKTVNIEVKTTGSVAENYMVGGTSLNLNRVEIQGPESAVSRVARAEVYVDVTGITNTSTASGDIVLVDAEGSEVTLGTISKNLEEVTATVEVWNIKEVPVSYEYTGEPAQGYQATGMETAIQSVRIAGPTRQLNLIQQLRVTPEDIDITGAAGDYETAVRLGKYLPDGISFADKGFDDVSQVKVSIEEVIEKRLTLRPENIRVVNVPEGMHFEIVGNGSSALVVRGLAAYTALLQSSTLQGVIDVGAWMEESNLTRLSEGDYSLPISVSLLPQQEQMSTPAITIRFSLIRDEDEEEGSEE